MSWWQLTVTCSRDELELTENTLLALGALSLTLGDAQDEPIYEPLPGDTPLWSKSTVTGLFEQTRSLEDLYDELVRKLPDHLVATIHREQLDDQVWERVFLDRYQPVRFGNRLWICPGWHDPPEPDACNVILDPGIAFGTGSHPTTALCLEFLDAHPPRNKDTMDYGCGSGILAIAAHKLGARSLRCIDIDEQALQATRNNAIRNDIDPESLNIAKPENTNQLPVDYLMANILSGPLIDLEHHFSTWCRPGAQLMLSGILPEQATQVEQAYARHFRLDAVKILDGWCRITGIRNHQA